MRILVTGAAGQLGREIVRRGSHCEIAAFDRGNVDVTDMDSVIGAVRGFRPEAVIHCAAYTGVDAAEADPDAAFRVNVAGSRNVALACQETGARLLYISTDYVFGGGRSWPYIESDPVNPLNIYGASKWRGEQEIRTITPRHYIVRTAWLYGQGHNFVRTMLKLSESNPELRVVCDQVGTPTSAAELAGAIFRILAGDAFGTYHATCQGECSWYDFAKEVFRLAGKQVTVCPVTSEEFPRPARRPDYSVLDNAMLRRTCGDPMKDWKHALTDYLRDAI